MAFIVHFIQTGVSDNSLRSSFSHILHAYVVFQPKIG